jgi:ADP-dependent NAD(P)H-hydrate dehydratase / NAD(P)H-hydrate epimerase
MPKIFDIDKIKQWDLYTIENEPISSLDLMERAANTAFEVIFEAYKKKLHHRTFHIFCGTGNNGGDGLVIARRLKENNANVRVYIVPTGSQSSPDFLTNLQKLKEYEVEIKEITQEKQLNYASFEPKDVIIDAILGAGLNRKVADELSKIFDYLNKSLPTIWSIDMPSGLFADKNSNGVCISAGYTLTFQVPKLAFFFAENAAYLGKVMVLDIGLHPDFYKKCEVRYETMTKKNLSVLIKQRKKHSHKGTFGHALLVAGSYGKMGAAVLAASACLRAGVGLLSVQIPKCGYDIVQIAVPEAMVIADSDIWQISQIAIKSYQAIGIGPGIGTSKETYLAFKQLLNKWTQPIVIDADALNLIAYYPDLQPLIPNKSILTPHPKEFERLFGATQNDFERLELLQKKAVSLNVVIILKGANTIIACPDGSVFFNTTGNPGMATAGSGDVLTGILLSLLAQQYDPKDAARLGVFLHGLAGDIAAQKNGEAALIARDIVAQLGKAYCKLHKNKQAKI